MTRGRGRGGAGRRSSLSQQQTEFLRLLGYLYLEHGMPSRAATIYTALSTLDPTDVYALKCLAYALLLSGQHGRALTIAEACLSLDLDRDDAELVGLVRGRALWHLDRREEARATVLRILQQRKARAMSAEAGREGAP